MKKILVFDKGGRKERKKLIKKNEAPRDFLQGIDFLSSKGFRIENLSSVKEYKRNFFYNLINFIEKLQSRISQVGIRPLSVYQFRKKINKSDYIVSLTDGFSISLGFYYMFLDRKNKVRIAGGFHKLSDYDRKIPGFLKNFYRKLLALILKRIDFIIFYGDADRKNSIKHFNIPVEKTYTIKFGVDIGFWIPKEDSSFESNFLFSIGQDPSRDFKTLLKVKTQKKIHIHTILLDARNDKNFRITNGTYNKTNFSDKDIRKFYQESFAVIVPLKNVFQPSGYSVTLQAMACGKPVILTKTRGLWAPEIFVNFKNCILVNPYSQIEIEEAIKFLEENKNKYNDICKESRNTIKNHFSIDKANEVTLDLFRNFS